MVYHIVGSVERECDVNAMRIIELVMITLFLSFPFDGHAVSLFWVNYFRKAEPLAFLPTCDSNVRSNRSIPVNKKAPIAANQYYNKCSIDLLVGTHVNKQWTCDAGSTETLFQRL